MVRRLFLRALALIYLSAFLSLWTQIEGLLGEQGILPAGRLLAAAAHQLGPWCYYHLPTLSWLNPGSGFLHLLCGGGVVLSLAAFLGLFQGVSFFLLWAFYLSLFTVGRDFLGFQWDILLLETGFLAISFAPWRTLPAPSREPPPSPVAVWLLRWLLFRLMFASGVVKLTAGDDTWWSCTALNYHYETQPLPTWIGWYAHQLPAGFQKLSVLVMFAIEIAVPFFIFLPRVFRIAAFFTFAAFQLLILLSGNYCFFNLLTIALSLLLIDDDFLRRLVRRPLPVSLTPPRAAPQAVAAGAPAAAGAAAAAEPRRPRAPFLQRTLTWATAAVVLVLSGIEMGELGFEILGSRHREWRSSMPELLLQVQGWAAPLHLANSYGLFRVMTTERREIVVEGSQDGKEWAAYEFKWKPGDVKRAPSFVAPHQPRLDWQMWFAVLGNYRSPRNLWFQRFLERLLEGSPAVLGLLEKNPFPGSPPRYVRAMVYDYHFTDPETRRATGQWWRRERVGLYCPVLSLPAR
jgi:hypothetical protein